MVGWRGLGERRSNAQVKTDTDQKPGDEATAAEAVAPRSRLRTAGIILGRALVTFVVVFGVGILGVRHYHRMARAKKDGSGLTPVAIEPARTEASLGSQRLTVDGIDLNIVRSWETGPPETVRTRITRRNQSLGWETLAGAPHNLPSGVLARPEFQFLCFLTANHKVVGYALNPDGHGTRITAAELDLVQLAKKPAGEKPAPVPPEYAALMPRPPHFALAGRDPAGVELYLVKMPAANPVAVAADIRERLLREGWTLEPWDAITGKDGLVQAGGEWLVAHRTPKMCHVMVVQEQDTVLASYRFSPARPVQTGAGVVEQ